MKRIAYNIYEGLLGPSSSKDTPGFPPAAIFHLAETVGLYFLTTERVKTTALPNECSTHNTSFVHDMQIYPKFSFTAGSLLKSETFSRYCAVIIWMRFRELMKIVNFNLPFRVRRRPWLQVCYWFPQLWNGCFATCLELRRCDQNCSRRDV